MLRGHIWDCIGQTPLLRIGSLSSLTGCEIWAKAEHLNPAGSVKDRAAKGMIERFEREGKLEPGFGIVEGTAGNTGIALATLGAERGYGVTIVMPNNQAQEKYDLLNTLGAELITVDPCPFSNPNHFYHQAKKIAASRSHTVWADQFENLANSEVHYSTTGPEIWEQTDGELDYFTCAVGTGGTISGVSQYLKEKKSSVRTVVADPLGSGIYEYLRRGEMKTEGTSITEGIGIMRTTANFLKAQVDEALRVTDEEMLSMVYHLAEQDGLVVGTSAGINLYSAYQLGLRHQGEGKIIVTMICDHGSRYQTRLFNPKWLAAKGLQVPSGLIVPK